MTLVAKCRLAAVVALAMTAAAVLRLRRVTVEGSSMEPTLVPGDRLLVVPAFSPRPGHIVAVLDPHDQDRLLVKRVASVDRRQGVISVEGDNRDVSTDSRAFGPMPRTAVVGRAVYRYAPAARSGLLPGRS
jgi:nickel-type superoxide dismutase maturation protease